mmetsp:Transcript_2145/g.14146  ORF Transcript_2145/g.14146 Transcript_2145/m.14146 type:complete len:225 (-) Transcript_2145:2829-3503(-)
MLHVFSLSIGWIDVHGSSRHRKSWSGPVALWVMPSCMCCDCVFFVRDVSIHLVGRFAFSLHAFVVAIVAHFGGLCLGFAMRGQRVPCALGAEHVSTHSAVMPSHKEREGLIALEASFGAFVRHPMVRHCALLSHVCVSGGHQLLRSTHESFHACRSTRSTRSTQVQWAADRAQARTKEDTRRWRSWQTPPSSSKERKGKDRKPANARRCVRLDGGGCSAGKWCR